MNPRKKLFGLALLGLTTIGLLESPSPTIADREVQAAAVAVRVKPELNVQAILDRSMRHDNYSGGSCVHASTANCFEHAGMKSDALRWKRSYSGGEGSGGLHSKLERGGYKYAYTTNGDPSFLDWCHRTKRIAGITYYSNHYINLVYLDEHRAGLVDNNDKGRIIWVERNTFIRNWRGHGGWATALVYNPPPPIPY